MDQGMEAGGGAFFIFCAHVRILFISAHRLDSTQINSPKANYNIRVNNLRTTSGHQPSTTYASAQPARQCLPVRPGKRSTRQGLLSCPRPPACILLRSDRFLPCWQLCNPSALALSLEGHRAGAWDIGLRTGRESSAPLFLLFTFM